MTNIFRIIGAVCLIAASGAGWAGAFTNYWYDLNASGSTTNMGLLNGCTAGSCAGLNFADNTQCSRSGSDLETRVHAVLGLTISSALIALVSCIVTAISLVSTVSVLLPVAIFGSVLVAASAGSGIALYVYTWENWYFCDGNFCSEYNLPNCSTSFDYSFFLVAATTGLGILALIALLVSFCTAPAPETTEETEMATHEPQNYQGSPYQNTQANHDPYVAPQNNIPPPPEGDWAFDSGSGLYWSDAEYLYLDTVTNQYFDPKSGQWYDPASQQWYFKD